MTAGEMGFHLGIDKMCKVPERNAVLRDLVDRGLIERADATNPLRPSCKLAGYRLAKGGV